MFNVQIILMHIDKLCIRILVTGRCRCVRWNMYGGRERPISIEQPCLFQPGTPNYSFLSTLILVCSKCGFDDHFRISLCAHVPICQPLMTDIDKRIACNWVKRSVWLKSIISAYHLHSYPRALVNACSAQSLVIMYANNRNWIIVFLPRMSIIYSGGDVMAAA